MKIAIIAPSRVPSNTANSLQVMKVSQSIAQIGHSVHVWVPGDQPVSWEEIHGKYGLSTPFELSPISSRPQLKRYDFSVLAFNQAIRWGAEAVYTWLPQVSILSQLRGLPSVLEVHDRPTGRFGPWLLRRSVQMRGKKKIAVITNALTRVLDTEFQLKIPERNLVVTPNGVDLERYEGLPNPSTARARLGLPVEQFTVVYTGHLYAGRGVDLLFGLAQSFPQLQFLLVGGNPESVEECRRWVSVAGIQNITLTGFVENQKLPLYQAAGDVLLMPYGRVIAGSSGGNSADICSPMKMFEYLASGRTILSSDLPVLHEILNEQNSVFCEIEDIESWQKGLQSLLDNPVKMQQLALQAKKDAGKFTWTARTRAVLDDLLLSEVQE